MAPRPGGGPLFYFLSKLLDLLLAPLSWALLLALAAALLLRRRPGLARWLLLAAGAELTVFSTPAVADALQRAAEGAAPRTFQAGQPYDVAVVLGGISEPRRVWMDDGEDLGGAAERLTRAFELVQAGQARVVLLSGGLADPGPGAASEAEELAVLLRRWGVPAERIAVETRSRNTHENAVESARLIAERGWRRVLLVTSARHMPRALGCFRREGLSPDALPVDYRGGAPGAAGHFSDWWPRAVELEASTEVLRELFGRLVYRWRGYSAD